MKIEYWCEDIGGLAKVCGRLPGATATCGPASRSTDTRPPSALGFGSPSIGDAGKSKT
jgi:hypothetical protein